MCSVTLEIFSINTWRMYELSVSVQAGYGYGLPISRLYARYFQGELTLYSLEGYGTDAVIYIRVSLLNVCQEKKGGCSHCSHPVLILWSQSHGRRSPPSPSRDCPCTTSRPGNTTRRSTRPTTGASPARSPRTWRRSAVSSSKGKRSMRDIRGAHVW